MRIKSKLLAGVMASAVLAGTAGAVDVTNTTGGAPGGDALALANNLDFTAPVTGNVVFTVAPSSGAFPTGNVLVDVILSGVSLSAALTGGELAGATTSVISTGGAKGDSTVRFLISGANLCAPCTVTLPVTLAGTDASVSVGLETDAGADVDNSNFTNRVATDLISLQDPFDIDFTPLMADPVADLDSLPTPYTVFDPAAGTSSGIGSISIAANSVDVSGPTTGGGAQTVSTDLTGTAVAATDIGDFDIASSGSFTAFDDDTTTPGGDIFCEDFGGMAPVSCDAVSPTAFAHDFANAFATYVLGVTADGTTPIERTSIPVDATVVGAGALLGGADFTASGSLNNIRREGTTIVFPWTASATQGQASGSASVFRFGNIGTADVGSVFVEALNSTNPGTFGPAEVKAEILEDGEAVVNAAAVQAAIGDYGRGDLEFTVEEGPEAITARMFVIRGGALQSVMPGTTTQDLGICGNTTSC